MSVVQYKGTPQRPNTKPNGLAGASLAARVAAEATRLRQKTGWKNHERSNSNYVVVSGWKIYSATATYNMPKLTQGP